jgi:hypothetical protein
MTLKRGSSAITAVKRGSSTVSKMYRGSTEVYTTSSPYVAPTLSGTGTEFIDGTNFTSRTFTSLHTPAEADVLIRFVGRANTTDTPNPSVTFQGQTGVVHCYAYGRANQRCFVAIATVRGLTPGVAGDLVINYGADYGNCTGWIRDISNWSGSVGGKKAESVYLASNTNTMTISDISIEQTGSLAVAVAGATDGDMDPFTAAGWTHEHSDSTGGAQSTDTAAGFFYKTLGTAGGEFSFTWVGSVSDWDRFAAAALELK